MHSAAQSRKLDRNPCVVTSLRCMRRKAMKNAVLESGLAVNRPGNTNREPLGRARARAKISTQRGDKGMR